MSGLIRTRIWKDLYLVASLAWPDVRNRVWPRETTWWHGLPGCFPTCVCSALPYLCVVVVINLCISCLTTTAVACSSSFIFMLAGV